MTETDLRFGSAGKAEIVKRLFEDRELPELGCGVEKTSYKDGLKIYFEKGGWIVVRFSGTEPLLRIFAEMDSEEAAVEVSRRMKKFLGMGA